MDEVEEAEDLEDAEEAANRRMDMTSKAVIICVRPGWKGLERIS